MLIDFSCTFVALVLSAHECRTLATFCITNLYVRVMLVFDRWEITGELMSKKANYGC